MKKTSTRLNISLSEPAYEILKETKKGTNLTDSDVIDMVIRQYFKPGNQRSKNL